MASKINATFRELGHEGTLTEEVMQTIIQSNPDIFPSSLIDDKVIGLRYSSLINVCHWLEAGGKSVFLQDADALIMRTPELVEVLKRLKKTSPTIERISCYARSKTCTHKSLEELRELYKAGLSRVLVGIESEHDPVLQFMQKGVTAGEHIEGGRKVIESGIGFIAFVMPGLGSQLEAAEHTRETVRVLNEIKPHLVRIRSLTIQQDSPLYDWWQSGKFEQPSDDQMVEEIKLQR